MNGGCTQIVDDERKVGLAAVALALSSAISTHSRRAAITMSLRIDTTAHAVVLWITIPYGCQVSYSALSAQGRAAEGAFRLRFHRVTGIG